MSSTSIREILGEPIEVIPLALYAQGAYDISTVTNGQAADLRGYHGALLVVNNTGFAGSGLARGVVIPSHGPCPEYATHEPFGSEWGFYYPGTGSGGPASDVRMLVADVDRTMPYLSCSFTVLPATGVFLGVTVYPLLPKQRPRELDAKHLEIVASGALSFPSLSPL